MRLQPDSLPALEDALEKAYSWQARAERLLKGGELFHFIVDYANGMSGTM